MTLTDFLLARIAEDEGTAHYAQTRDDIQPEDWGGWWLGHYQHYSRYDPARVIAECEAKRRLVEEFRSTELKVRYRKERGHEPDDFYSGYAAAAENILRDFAEVYADHPDYQQEWKP